MQGIEPGRFIGYERVSGEVRSAQRRYGQLPKIASEKVSYNDNFLLKDLPQRYCFLMSHIVLLGDSILDNGRYTSGGPDVISQVRRLLPKNWNATLLAIDGSTTEAIPSQLERVPADASHLVLSVGGNDALMKLDILHMPAASSAEVLMLFADIAGDFEKAYRSAVEACQKLGLHLALCTIYNGCFPDPDYQRAVSTALMVFNDVIMRVGIESCLSIIDLRFVCLSAADYANPIEPSSVGGAKIARAIVNLVMNNRGTCSGNHVVIS